MVWNMKISVLHSKMESLPIMNAAIMIQKNRTKNIFLKICYSNTKHFLWENLLSEPTRPLMPWDSSLAFPICCRSSLKKRPDHILQLVILASLTKRNYALTTRTERKWSPKKTTIPYCVTPTADMLISDATQILRSHIMNWATLSSMAETVVKYPL